MVSLFVFYLLSWCVLSSLGCVFVVLGCLYVPIYLRIICCYSLSLFHSLCMLTVVKTTDVCCHSSCHSSSLLSCCRVVVLSCCLLFLPPQKSKLPFTLTQFDWFETVHSTCYLALSGTKSAAVSNG